MLIKFQDSALILRCRIDWRQVQVQLIRYFSPTDMLADILFSYVADAVSFSDSFNWHFIIDLFFILCWHDGFNRLSAVEIFLYMKLSISNFSLVAHFTNRVLPLHMTLPETRHQHSHVGTINTLDSIMPHWCLNELDELQDACWPLACISVRQKPAAEPAPPPQVYPEPQEFPVYAPRTIPDIAFMQFCHWYYSPLPGAYWFASIKQAMCSHKVCIVVCGLWFTWHQRSYDRLCFYDIHLWRALWSVDVDQIQSTHIVN